MTWSFSFYSKKVFIWCKHNANLDFLENGGILVLDEIENGLHPAPVKEMISLFIDEESNPHHAQLICTTHQPLLVSENVKRDQVWILSKDKYGKIRARDSHGNDPYPPRG